MRAQCPLAPHRAVVAAAATDAPVPHYKVARLYEPVAQIPAFASYPFHPAHRLMARNQRQHILGQARVADARVDAGDAVDDVEL